MGMIKHDQMSFAPSGLAGALFSRTQQRVLGFIFGQPERSFFANELISLTGGGTGAIQREIKRLVESGLVTVTLLGRQKHYQANPASPVFDELCSIARKTFGLAAPLQEALAPLNDRIDVAFVYGSVAKQTDNSQSDIDLMVISDSVDYADLFSALEGTTATLGREINPTLYSSSILRQKLNEGNSFVNRVLVQDKVFIIGDEHALIA